MRMFTRKPVENTSEENNATVEVEDNNKQDNTSVDDGNGNVPATEQETMDDERPVSVDEEAEDIGEDTVVTDDAGDGEAEFGQPIEFEDDSLSSEEVVDDGTIEKDVPTINVSTAACADDVEIDEQDNVAEETDSFVPREDYERVCDELETSERRRQTLLSDWENYKRRTVADVEQAKKLACSELAVDILPVLDDLERAISHARASEQTEIADGMMSIYKKALGVYMKHGIERVYPKGEVFDTEKHMAVSRISADEANVDEGMVDQVLQCGYVMGEVVLRPAMVTVAC